MSSISIVVNEKGVSGGKFHDPLEIFHDPLPGPDPSVEKPWFKGHSDMTSHKVKRCESIVLKTN